MKSHLVSLLPLAIALMGCGGSSGDKPDTSSTPQNSGTSNPDSGNTGGDNSGGDGKDQSLVVFAEEQLQVDLDLTQDRKATVNLDFVIHDYDASYSFSEVKGFGYQYDLLSYSSIDEEKVSTEDTVSVKLGFETTAQHCGEYHTEISLNVESNGESTGYRIPVDYKIKNQGMLHKLLPAQLGENQTGHLIVSGCGLDTVNASQLSFRQGETRLDISDDQLQVISPYRLKIKDVSLSAGSWSLAVERDNGSVSTQYLNVFAPDTGSVTAGVGWNEDNENQVGGLFWNDVSDNLQVLLDKNFIVMTANSGGSISSVWPTTQNLDVYKSVTQVQPYRSSTRSNALVLSDGKVYEVPVGFDAPSQISLIFDELDLSSPDFITYLDTHELLVKHATHGAYLVDLLRKRAVKHESLSTLNMDYAFAVPGQASVVALSGNKLSMFDLASNRVVNEYTLDQAPVLRNTRIDLSGQYVIVAKQEGVELLNLQLSPVIAFDSSRGFGMDVSTDGEYLYLSVGKDEEDGKADVLRFAKNQWVLDGDSLIDEDTPRLADLETGYQSAIALSRSGQYIAISGDKGIEIKRTADF